MDHALVDLLSIINGLTDHFDIQKAAATGNVGEAVKMTHLGRTLRNACNGVSGLGENTRAGA
jgi:hypothetical protein